MKAVSSQLQGEEFGALSTAAAGKGRRLSRLFRAGNRKIVIVPVDDSLIFGPTGGLEQLDFKLAKILEDPPDAILAFLGVFRTQSAAFSGVGCVINLTASTSRSMHTSKVQVTTVEQAVQLGVDGVAVHVNVTSKYESDMLRTLGSVSRECERFGMPLVAIMYPRSELDSGDNNYEELKNTDRKQYSKLVAHSARIAVDLGADLIKTKYTGDPDSFRTVIEACRPTPIIVAGGPVIHPKTMLQIAHDVISVGGAGVSFGRNVFGRENPKPFVSALKAIIHNNCNPEEAAERMNISQQE
jgi:DhnA family fructose-bisphosphate aldolase class Ia